MSTILTLENPWLLSFFGALLFSGWLFHRHPPECQEDESDNDYEYVETWTWPTWKGTE